MPRQCGKLGHYANHPLSNALWDKTRSFETSIIHFPTSEGVSEVSERANEWAQWRARAKQAVRSKRTSERCERTSEETSEWPSTYVSILVCSRPQCIRKGNFPQTLGKRLGSDDRVRSFSFRADSMTNNKVLCQTCFLPSRIQGHSLKSILFCAYLNLIT